MGYKRPETVRGRENEGDSALIFETAEWTWSPVGGEARRV